MCGRFSNRFTWRELHDLYQAFLTGTPSSWRPRFNIAPTDQIPVIRFIDGARRIDLMRWGLIPAWAKADHARLDALERWVRRHYRERLRPDELGDPAEEVDEELSCWSE